MLVGEDAGGVKTVQRAFVGPMVLPEEHNAVGFGAGEVRVAGEFGLGQGPECKGRGLGAGDEVPHSGKLLLVEVPDFQELLHRGIAAQLRAVLHHFSGEERADAGKGQERGTIGHVDVDAWNVDKRFQTREDGIGHHVTSGEVRRAAEVSAFLPIVVDGERLLLAEAQALKVFHAHGVGVEAEGLHRPGSGFFPHGNGLGAV